MRDDPDQPVPKRAMGLIFEIVEQINEGSAIRPQLPDLKFISPHRVPECPNDVCEEQKNKHGIGHKAQKATPLIVGNRCAASFRLLRSAWRSDFQTHCQTK